MKKFIKNHTIITHICTTLVGDTVGQNLGQSLGYYFSGGDRLIQIVNGYAMGLITNIAFNIGMYYYIKHIKIDDTEKYHYTPSSKEIITPDTRASFTNYYC